MENSLFITPFIDLAIFKISYNNESNYKLDCQILGDMLSIFELEIKWITRCRENTQPVNTGNKCEKPTSGHRTPDKLLYPDKISFT